MKSPIIIYIYEVNAQAQHLLTVKVIRNQGQVKKFVNVWS